MANTKNVSDIPEIDLSNYTLEQSALGLIPASISQKYKMIPLFKIGNTLTIAMADPKNIIALDEARTSSGMDISVVKSDKKQIEQAISENYGIAAVVEEVLKEYRTKEEVKVKKSTAEEAPIIKLVNAIVNQAVNEKASDIHIEPEAKDLRVRYRIDGILHEELTLPAYMLAPVVSRVKVIAGMDIAESRVPQDGRLEINMEGRSIDMRISTFPASYGEKVVMRILDKSSMQISLADIGFSKENLEKFRSAIHKPHGIILVTGPTGSGKTTTLYSALTEINSKEINIITVEDPIEYELPGICQSQVNTKAGLTFANALRSILRQDPDVIFIGEVRDLETAEISIQSSLTGHLVLSTLHTNDSAGALTRLTDMGVEPFLISSSVEAILAQRLVRIICRKCKQEVPADEVISSKFPGLKTLYKGQGCKTCKGTGYKGRTGLFELLMLDQNIKDMVIAKDSSANIKQYAVKNGMKTLFDDGIDKVKQGITTLDEVLRVTELEQV